MHPLYFYLGATVITFLVFGFDKLAARKSWRRIPEKTLHLLSFAGGFIGALFGRTYFRHKTTRAKFLIIPVVAAIVHAAFWLIQSRN